MDRVEGERVKFVVLKRLEYDNKIRILLGSTIS